MQPLGKAFSKFFTEFAEGIKLLLVDFSIQSGINVLKCTLGVIMIRFNTHIRIFTALRRKAILILSVAKTYIPEGKSFIERGGGRK